MLQRQITVCHGPCCPPGRVNLDCSPSVCPKPSTHWSHRLFTGISLHSSHYLGLACQGRFAPMKQSSHSLAFNKVFCRPNEAEDEWKAKKLFWTHSGETKIFGFFFFFGNGGRSLELLPISGSFRAAPSTARSLISAQSGHPEHGVSLDYLTFPGQTTASPLESMGKSWRNHSHSPSISSLISMQCVTV